jgi:preprotein translocase subunit YajC
MKNILEQLAHLDETELQKLNKEVIFHLRRTRAAKSKAMKMSLNEGDKVRWSGKRGLQTGTVVSIKRKFAHIETGLGRWRVPMNMLEVI